MNIMKVICRKALAKFVPAAAVKRIEQVLFIGTRLKALSGGNMFFTYLNKILGFNPWTIYNNVLLDYDRNI